MKDKLKKSKSDIDWHPKYFWIFAVIFVVVYVIDMILVPKVFVFHGITMTAGILLFPIVCILGDIITEVYGFNNARKVIWLGFCANILLMLSTQLAMFLPQSLNPDIDKAFVDLFSLTPRLVFASISAYLVGGFVNAYVVSVMKVKQKGEWFGIRAVLSTVAGQFVDSIIVVVIAFSGVLPLANLLSLMFFAWVIKVLYEIIVLPVTIKIVAYIKKKEGVEHFDLSGISIV